MLFFDNEIGNCRDVAKLGVTCVYTPNGMTELLWREGLTKFAKRAFSDDSAQESMISKGEGNVDTVSDGVIL